MLCHLCNHVKNHWCIETTDSFVDNLMLGVQVADVSTRCSSHPRGKSEARCENDGNL